MVMQFGDEAMTASNARVDRIMQLAFHPARMPRSDEYKDGVRSTIQHALDTAMRADPYPDCPYPLGTAQADAWFSGKFEGRLIIQGGEFAGLLS